MRPDDDDIPDSGGGPPPDPSMRQWRHPSEIAAAASAAARPDPPSPEQRRRRTALATAIGVGLVATVVVGLGATLVATMTLSGNGVDLDSTDDGMAGTNTASALDQATGIRPPALLTTPTTATSTTTTISTTTTTTTVASASTETTLAPLVVVNGVYTGSPSGPADELEVEVEDGDESPGQSFSAPDNAQDDPDQRWPTTTSAGAAPAPVPAVRLGDFVVIDDLILTSASAIKGNAELHLVIDGLWVPVEVYGQDPLTDLALLRVREGAPAVDLSPVRLAWSLDGETFTMPETGTSIFIGDDEQPAEGAIVGPKDRVVSATGEPIYSAWLTNAKRPEGSSGAAATDAEGRLVGLVVNSPDYLASLVSVETMFDVGHMIMEWGRPALEWLGFEGQTPKSGGVMVLSVEEDGPGDVGDIRPGDHLVKFDRKPIVDHAHLAFLARQAGVGAEVSLVLERDGRRLIRTVTIESFVPLSGSE